MLRQFRPSINYCDYSIYTPFEHFVTAEFPVEITLPMCYFALGRYIDALS